MVAHWVSVEAAERLVGRSQRTLQLWAACGWVDREVGSDGRVRYGVASLLATRESRDVARRVSRKAGPGRGRCFPCQVEGLWDE